MPEKVIMPKMGWTMTEGTIVRWLKGEGEKVMEGEPLLNIETDKVTVEVDAPATGIVGKIVATEGETVPVVQVIAYILSPGEDPPREWPTPLHLEGIVEPKPMSTSDDISGAPLSKRLASNERVDRTEVKGSGEGDLISKEDIPNIKSQPPLSAGRERSEAQVKASPRARMLAEERGADLSNIEGTGPAGSITEQNVLDYAARRPVPGEVIIPGRIQKIAAQRMTESFTSTPHFYLNVEAQVIKLVELRERHMPSIQTRANVRLTFTDLLIVLVAKALREHPLLNASWENGKIKIASEINIGVATAVREGLVVPVIKWADKKSLEEIAQDRKELAEKGREGKLSMEESEGGTFTLTNLGMFEVDEFEAIINPPQSAILAAGRIAERPVAENGRVVARPTIRLTLSLDHRVIDGANGARFLSDLKALVEEPADVIGSKVSCE